MPSPRPDPPADPSRIDVPADTAFVDGHFPGRPIVPGAALLQMVLARLRPQGDAAALIHRVRFLRPVLPGARLTLAVEADGGLLRFAVQDGVGAVLQGALAFAEAEA